MRTVLTFMDHQDEATLWAELKRRRPELTIIDGQRWSTTSPPTRDSPTACRELRCFLWSPIVAPFLPTVKRGELFDGPAVGPVVEWSRCREQDGVLYSGRLAAGFDDDNDLIADLVKTVFSAVAQATSDEVEPLSGHVSRRYRIGASARRRALDELALRDQAVPLYFRATELPPGP